MSGEGPRKELPKATWFAVCTPRLALLLDGSSIPPYSIPTTPPRHVFSAPHYTHPLRKARTTRAAREAERCLPALERLVLLYG